MSKTRTLDRQFTISSSLSSIIWARKHKEAERGEGNKIEANTKNLKIKPNINNVKLNIVNPHMKNVKRFKDLHLDPYVLPLLKHRLLSPTSRARKILGKTPKLDKCKKVELDSSMEKSLEKIEKEPYDR